MRQIIYFVLVIALVPVHVQAQTQQLKFTRINLLEDASLGQVNFIAEDQYGFIWMSEESNGALTRFDGHNIKRYTSIPGEENSLGGPYPECLLIDKDGYIWIGLFGYGLDRFDPLTETFTHYIHNPENPNSLSNNTVSAVLQDREGTIYIATFDGMDVLDPETGQFTHFKHDPENNSSLSSNYVRELYEDREGTLWVGTGWFGEGSRGGLNRFDKKTGTFERFMADPQNPNALSNERITALFEDSRNTFWVGTGDGLYAFDRKNKTFTPHRTDSRNPNKLGAPFYSEGYYGVTLIAEDHLGNLWVGGEGVNVYNPESQTMTHYGDNRDADGTFIENSSWCIHMGGNGLIWLSTQPGVYKIDPYNFTIPRKQGLIPSQIIESDSITWTGTENGIIKTNHQTGSQRQWTHDPSEPISLSNNFVLSLSQDEHGHLWIGTNRGLNRLNTKDGIITRYLHDPLDDSSISGNIIRDLVQDENDILWVGTERGLNKMDQTSGKFQLLRIRDVMEGNLASISRICVGQDNTLWIGEFSTGSVLKYNILNGESIFYSIANGVNDLFRDHKQSIWAATPSGLYRYDQEIDRFVAHTHGPMIAITEDLNRNLWASSRSGVFRINQNRDNIVNYTGQSVNRSGDLNALNGSGYVDQDGKIVIGDAESYFVFDPNEIVIPPDTSKLYFTNLWLGVNQENAMVSSAIFQNRDLHLTYNQNTFSLSFTELDQRSPKRNKIMYRLENYDLEWRACYSEEKVTYMNVPHGNYIFKIKASNSSTGIWTENQLMIAIAPPWWRTWWAYIVYAVLFALGIFMVDRFQRRRLVARERAKAQEKELAQAKEIEKAYHKLQETQSQLIHAEKMASLGELTAGIAHEIQNPLNFVNNFSEVSSEMIKDAKEELKQGEVSGIEDILNDLDQNLEKINHHGDRASSIVKGMLAHSRSSEGEKESTDINALCDEYIRLAYHGLRAKDRDFSASFVTHLDQDIPVIEVVREEIGRVLLNLLNNAFYAVRKKKQQSSQEYNPLVTLSTSLKNDLVEITLQDNGTGIPDGVKDKIFQPFFTTKPTGSGTGLGLSLSYDIIKAHGGEIKVESQPEQGTAFIITLPLNRITNDSTKA